MGKPRYNAKARQVVKTDVDNTRTSEIRLEFSKSEYGVSDVSNLLALPSKKRETKVIKEKKEKVRFLSKAQRKRLEKIVDKKKKKENRASLLESLSKVQATPEEVKQLTTISSVQTIGLRKLNELTTELPVQQVAQVRTKKLSNVRGAYKRRNLLKHPNTEMVKKKKYDPNVVGLEPESEDSSDSSDTDTEEQVVNGNTNKANGISTADNEANENTTDNSKKSDTSEVIVIEDDTPDKPEESKKPNKEKKETKNESKADVKIEKKPSLTHNTVHVPVERDPKIQVARLKLPILGEEQRIMELINENEILIVAGATGSGKTTQIPQFLYEAGYARHKMIGITEPRRVATVAMASRVGRELGLSKNEVSYLMRFEGNVTKDTKIKFMTDGVLLKEIQSDFLLSRYSVIIIDEAHERSAYTDLLLGLMSKIVPLRKKRGVPLRLIIMSATLRAEDFTENTRLFPEPPPVIVVESRQFPVTVHFSKNTPSDYIKEAYKKAVKIHTKLPDGGILIFVTGQDEVYQLVRKLKKAFPYRKGTDYSKLDTKPKTADVDAALDSEPDDTEYDGDEVYKELIRASKPRRKATRRKNRPLPKINLDDYGMLEDDGQADLLHDGDDSEGHFSDSDTDDYTLLPSIKSCRQPLWVLPLYSMLGSAEQGRVFQRPPPGCRLCVVSTDVAETSLTIPAVKYVVDTGKKKARVYDHATGASAYRIVWTSQASAEQRSGRAGRVGPGHAYRLYSSAVFQHDCPPQYPPDLCRRPIDDLVLTMKAMGIYKVASFPFPTAPDRMQLRLAEKRLETLGLLQRVQTKSRKPDEEEILKVTELGEAASSYPVLPRYGKILALSNQRKLLPYAIALVSALSVPQVIENGKQESWVAPGHMQLLGDLGVLLRAVGATEQAHFKGEEEAFCAKYGVRQKAIQEIRKLRKQITSEIDLTYSDLLDLRVDPELKPPDDDQSRLLRQLVLCGLGDQVARKIALTEVKQGEDKRKFKYAYHCAELEEPVYMRFDSILRKTIPDWVVYQELYETGPEGRTKMIMKNVAAIEPEWLPVYVPQLCNLGDPLSDPPPRYDEKSGTVKCHFKGTFSSAGWQLPLMELEYPDSIEKYKLFASFLLEGTVFPKLKKFTKSLLSSPSTMVKTWAKLQPRTELLLKALIAKRAGSREELKNLWQQNGNYLLYEYQKWLPVSAHNDVALRWPPV